MKKQNVIDLAQYLADNEPYFGGSAIITTIDKDGKKIIIKEVKKSIKKLAEKNRKGE